MRQFGVAGLGITGAGFATIQQMATSVIPAANNAAKAANLNYWGCDLNRVPVTNQAQFNAAVAMLSTPVGRDPANRAGLLYPPAWTQLDLNFNTTDPSSAAAEMVGNPAATVKALNSIGVSTLMVYWLSCTASTCIFQSTDMTTAIYWGERWEVRRGAPGCARAAAPLTPPAAACRAAVQAPVHPGGLGLAARHHARRVLERGAQRSCRRAPALAHRV